MSDTPETDSQTPDSPELEPSAFSLPKPILSDLENGEVHPVAVEILPVVTEVQPTLESKPTEVHDPLELKAESAVIAEAPSNEEKQLSSQVSWSSFLIGQAVTLALVVFGLLWMRDTGSKGDLPVAPAATVTAAAPVSADVSALESSLSRAQDQILALQKQIDAQTKERERTQASLQEMSDRMALVIKQASFAPCAPAQNLTTNDASQVAAMMPSVTPATSELILLKERNRLTEYADRAITTGTRDALQAVVEAMFDPQMPSMHHAAGAEFRRVQAYFEISSSIDPAYKLPLQELFKDGSVTAEADLKPAQLVKLMHDHQQPWEVRLRSAYLLRASADPATNAALLKTIKDDPSLDVVKQAQTSFEKRVGQRFRLFDIPSIEAWWATQTKK